jgi:hypothetical protein
MRLQLFKRHLAIDGLTIAKDMEVVPLEINNLLMILSEYVSISDIPLIWNNPVQALRARRYFMSYEVRDVFTEDRMRLSHTVSGDASANRKKSLRKSVHLQPIGR